MCRQSGSSWGAAPSQNGCLLWMAVVSSPCFLRGGNDLKTHSKASCFPFRKRSKQKLLETMQSMLFSPCKTKYFMLLQGGGGGGSDNSFEFSFLVNNLANAPFCRNTQKPEGPILLLIPLLAPGELRIRGAAHGHWVCQLGCSGPSFPRSHAPAGTPYFWPKMR